MGDQDGSKTIPPGQQVLKRLRDLERRPLEALVLYQARRLETLLRHARRNVPFYKNRLDAVFDAGDTLDLSRWFDVPVLTREEARRHSDELKAAAAPAEAGKVMSDRTSGSGGAPFFFFRSSSAYSADIGNSLRVFLDHVFDLDGRMCDIRIDAGGKAPWPEGARREDWTHGKGTGDYALLDIDTDLDKQIDWLQRRQPRTLFTWASNARQIALELERTGRSLPLTTIATSAEPCTPAVREDCRRVFGLRPIDILGTREIGMIAFPCNQSSNHHFAAESAFIEVIADGGRPAAPGESGQLVATGFYNFHMPFIRYALGDYVTLAEQPCRCGRSLPAVSRILGRGRGRFATADGRKIFPALPEAELDAIVRPYGWQVAQTGIGRLEMRVDAVDAAVLDAQKPKLAEILRRCFGEPVTFTIVEQSLQPGPSRRKHEPFRNEFD